MFFVMKFKFQPTFYFSNVLKMEAPKRKTINHKGPYMPHYEKEHFWGSVLHDKTIQGRHYKLTPEGEKAAFLYAALDSSNLDQIFLDNYWTDFKTYLGDDQPFDKFEEIDWSDVKAKLFLKRYTDTEHSDASGYGFVKVDGNVYIASPFAADDMSIFFGDDDKDQRRGRISRAITPTDVTLNLSSDNKHKIPNISEFNVVYKPDMNWAAKWNNPVTGHCKYMVITPYTLVTSQCLVETYTDSDSEEEVRDDESEASEYNYRDVDFWTMENPNPNVEDLFGDINDLTDDDEEREDEDKREDPYMESIPREEQLDFNSLDDEEMDLPFSYIVAPITQWQYVLDACNSKFRVVGHLGKVSNSILKLVADGSFLALRNGTERLPSLNESFIQYAKQRGV
jgi:hypothetical protein